MLKSKVDGNSRLTGRQLSRSIHLFFGKKTKSLPGQFWDRIVAIHPHWVVYTLVDASQCRNKRRAIQFLVYIYTTVQIMNRLNPLKSSTVVFVCFPLVIFVYCVYFFAIFIHVFQYFLDSLARNNFTLDFWFSFVPAEPVPKKENNLFPFFCSISLFMLFCIRRVGTINLCV